MTLSFLSLSPIPELKLTDQGLIDASKMQRTTLIVPENASASAHQVKNGSEKTGS